MHVNPLVSDGQYTIGYDDNGLAGEWDGNMSETCEDFREASEGYTFSDGNEEYVAVLGYSGKFDTETIVWK